MIDGVIMKNKLTKVVLLLLASVILLYYGYDYYSKRELRELCNTTDKFVESLYTTYESYGLLGGTPESVADGLYTVRPIGRLINVKIEKFVNDDVYEDLRLYLEKYYKDNHRVNRVYISGGGTVMIDCRN